MIARCSRKFAYIQIEYARYHKMTTGHIYLLINKVNGHKYVGQTKRGVNTRWKQHIDEARRMSPKPLHRAIRKHGAHQFMIKELCECPVEELDAKEEEFIQKYNTFEDSSHYNATSGGRTPEFDQPTKDKLSVWAQERERTQQHSDNIKDTLQNKIEDNDLWGFHLKENRGDGKHRSIRILAVNVETGEETIYESFRAAALALKGDPKYSGGICRACKNGWMCYGHRFKKLDDKERSIKVYGVHYKTWEETKVFDSIKEASRIMGLQEGNIRRSLRNRYKSKSGEYFWFKA